MRGFYAYPDNTRVPRQPLVCHTNHSYENSQSPNPSLPHHKRIDLILSLLWWSWWIYGNFTDYSMQLKNLQVAKPEITEERTTVSCNPGSFQKGLF